MKPFRLQRIPARDLRRGDLMRCGTGGSYVLVADALIVDGAIKVSIYDCKTKTPTEPHITLDPNAQVALTGRNMRP